MKANVKTGALWFLAGALVMSLARPDSLIRPASAQEAQAASNVEYEYNSQIDGEKNAATTAAGESAGASGIC